VAEVFRVLAGELDDPEVLKLIGAVSTEERWCYPEWADLLARSPARREIALRFLDRYPESGIARALAAAGRSTRPAPVRGGSGPPASPPPGSGR
jgi:hypothetical protein